MDKWFRVFFIIVPIVVMVLGIPLGFIFGEFTADHTIWDRFLCGLFIGCINTGIYLFLFFVYLLAKASSQVGNMRYK